MKKPMYKNWWFILGVFLIIGVISGINNNIKGTTTTSANKQSLKADTVKEENKKEEIVTDIQPGITKEYIEFKLKDTQIIKIDNSGDNYYTIDFKVKDVISEKYYKKSILGTIKDISKVLNDAGLVQGNEFFFEAKGPGKDKYGNEVDMNYATGFVKGDELAKCNFDNLKAEDTEGILQSFGLNKSLK